MDADSKETDEDWNILRSLLTEDELHEIDQQLRQPIVPPFLFSIVCQSPYGTIYCDSNVGRSDCDSFNNYDSFDSCNQETVYRGAYPTLLNFRFLRRLNLTTILSLTPEAPTKDLSQFCASEGIKSIHLKIKPIHDDDNEIDIKFQTICDILQILLNVDNLPIYIHDLDGIRVCGLIVACLRKLQNWEFATIEKEFRKYLKVSETMEDIEVNFIKTFEGPIKLPYSMHKLASWLWPYFHRTKRKKLWHNIEAQKKYKQNLLQQQRQQRQQQQKQQKQQQQNEKSNLSISKDTNIDNVSTTIQEKKKVKFNSNVPSISTISNHINPDYEPPHHAGIKFIDMPQPKQMRPKRQNMSVTPTSNKNSALRPQMIRSRTAGETSSHGSHSNSSSSNISPLRNNNGISNIDNIKMQSPHLLRKLVNFTKRNSNSNKNSKSDRKNSRDRATVNNDGNSGNRRSVTSRSLNKVFSGVSTIRSITSNKLKLGEKNEKKDDGNGSLSPQFVAINLSALFDRNSGPTPQSSMTPLIVEASAPMTDYTTQDSQDNDNQDIQDIQNTQQMQDNQDNQDNLTIQDITDRMRDSSGNGNGNSSSNSNLISDNNDSNGNGRKESNISISHRDTIDDDFSSEGYHSTPFQTPMAASLSAGIGHNNHDGMTSVNNHNNNNVNGGSSRVNNILNMNETNKSTSTAFDFFDNMNVNLDESLSHINVNMDEIDNINIDGINSLSNINIDRIEHFSSIDNIDDDDLDQLEQQIELEKQKRNALRQHSRSRSSRRGSKGNKEHGSNDDIINESKGGQGGILRQLSRAGSETSNGFSEIEINQSIARHNIDSILRLNSELTDINDGKTDGDIGTIINRNNSGHSGHSGHGRAISYGKEFENDFNDMLILESGISDANLKFALNGQMVNMSNMNGDNNNNENAIINDDSELINNMKRVKNGSLSVSQFGSGLQSYSQSRSETIANGALNTGASIQGLGSNGLNMFESDQMNALALECGDVDLSLLRNENLSTFLEGHR